MNARALLCCGMWLAGGAGSLDAVAQATSAPSATESAPLEEVIVTGSRISVPAGVGSTSPLQVISSEEVQLQGHTDTIDVLNNLPQNFINASVDFGNSSNPLSAPGGITTVDLRGLGPQRTLVLVDGKRLGAGDPNTANPNPAPDIDQIPAALIQRVEIVTGGASATYGSDAIAGVVNFIMKRDFQGIQIDGTYGFTQHSNGNRDFQKLQADLDWNPPTGSVTDGQKRDVSVVMGTGIADNTGNLTAYFSYHNQASVPGSTRDFSNCEIGPNGDGTWFCFGSSNSNRYTLAATQELVNGSFVRTAIPGQPRLTVVGTDFLPWPQNGSDPPAQFNSNAYEYLLRGDLRYNAGFMAHIDLADWAKPYIDFSFMNDKTDVVVGPSALFNGGNVAAPPGITPNGGWFVNCSNPLLSAQEAAQLCSPAQIAADAANPGSVQAEIGIGRRNVEGGGREAIFEHTNYRIVGGLRGDLGRAWNYDAYGQFYYTSLFNSNQNYLNIQSVQNALQVAPNGQCISGPPCVPYDIFKTGGVTADQLAYLYTPGTAYGQNWEEIAHVDMTGDLSKYGVKLPWAADGVQMNMGVEHRFESLKFAPDGSELSGALSGFSGASVAINNGYSVDEGFLEVRAPLAHDQPGIKDLVVDAGYRYSKYSLAGKTNTYKFEVQYAPIDSLSVRYSFDRAVRAPNLIELFNPQSYGQQSFIGIDPCAPTIDKNNGNVIAATATLAQCEHTGVTAAQYGNGGTTNTIQQCVSNQCGQVIGGSTALKPETADTYSIGVTAAPGLVPGLTGTIDYFHIQMDNLVGSLPGAVLFNGCLLNGTPQFCSQIVRSPLGDLFGASVAGGGYILQTSVNTGAALFSGIDLGLNYRLNLGRMGALASALNGTYLEHTTATPYTGAHTYDCAGLFGTTCGNGINPRWRHTLRFNWETPWRKLLVSLNWRYIGSTSFDNNSNDPSLHFVESTAAGAPGYDAQRATIKAYSYFDLAVVWPAWKGIELRGGLNNIADKDPPILGDDITGTGSPNTYPSYDILGRQIFVAFTAKF